jgi:thioredoxin reductase
VPQVHLLVRGEKMRASKAMQDRVLRHPAVTVHFNTGIDDAYGDGKALQGLHLVNTQTGEDRGGGGGGGAGEAEEAGAAAAWALLWAWHEQSEWRAVRVLRAVFCGCLVRTSLTLLLESCAGEKSDLPVKGLFYGIGHKPNSGGCG